MKKHIPNICTCCNLLSGASAILFALSGAYTHAFLFIIIGALFDFCDGALARKLGVSGPMGVELDSLADDITFGLAPAMILYSFLAPQIGHWALIALLMAAFSALRLAKFNIDERQHENFIGLATPANAIFWASLCSMPLFPQAQEVVCTPESAGVAPYLPWGLLAISLVSCWLLVSEVPFFSLKFKQFGWSANKARYIFLIGCIIILAFCILLAIRHQHGEYALFSGAACISWYVVMNLIYKN